MNIVEDKYEWARPLSKRSNTKFCIIHHEAGSGMSVQQIHQMHMKQGWAGIGYHFVITKSGVIHRGRPIETIGTHTMNYNGNSIGVCFEGNYENEELSAAAFKSGIELLTYINDLYPNIIFKRHKDFNATACPGKNFPFEKMTEEVEQMTGEQIAKKLDEYYASLDMPQWAESEINEAIKLGLTDGSELCKPVPGYRAIIFALRAYKKGLNDNA